MSEAQGMGLGGCEVAAGPESRPLGRVVDPAPAPVATPTPAERALVLAVAVLPAAAIALFGGIREEHAGILRAAVLLLAAGVLGARVWRGQRLVPEPRLALPALALAALPVLQLIPLPEGVTALVSPGVARLSATLAISAPRTLSVYPYATRLALIGWLAYAAFLITALDVLRRPGALRDVLAITAAVGIAEALYGIGNLLLGNHQVLWLPRQTSLGSATGTLFDSNHYAAVLELALPALLAWHWLEPSGKARRARTRMVMLGLAAGAMGLGIVLSRSRGAFLCLAAVLTVVAAVTRPRDRDRRAARALAIGLGLLVLVTGVLVGLDPPATDPPGRVAAAPEEMSRPQLWYDTLAIARDFPLFGAGAGTFRHLFPVYRRVGGDAVYAHAHDDYVELAAEGGLVAVGLGATIVIVFGLMAWHGFGRLRTREMWALGALVAGIGASLLHAAIDFPLHVPGIALLLVLLAAAAVTLAEEGT